MKKDNINVWIAIWYSGSSFDTGHHLLGVYSTKEKAEARIAEFKDSGFFFVDPEGKDSDDCFIYEHKVDEKILTIGEAYEEKYRYD